MQKWPGEQVGLVSLPPLALRAVLQVDAWTQSHFLRLVCYIEWLRIALHDLTHYVNCLGMRDGASPCKEYEMIKSQVL